MSRSHLSRLATIALLLLSTTLVGGAATEGSEDTTWDSAARKVILVLEDGSVRELATHASLSDEELTGVDHAWSWTSGMPPSKLTVEELHDPLPADDGSKLRVFVPLRGGAREMPREVIAAPQEMWEEVPESMLPSFALPREVSAVELPIDPLLSWRLRALAPERGSWWVDVPAGETVATVATVASDSLGLRVAATETGPLPNARISVLAGNAERGDVRKLADYRTGGDGRVEIPALPDLSEVVLLISAEGHAPASFQGLPSHLGGDLVVSPGIDVRGRFVSEEGLPLTGVRVRAQGWVTEDLPLPISRWRATGTDGTWEFSSLPARRFEISALGAERTPWSRVVDLQSRAVRDGRLDLGDIPLGPAHAIEVTVVDDTGAPVRGARLQVDGRPQGATTDEAGRAWADLTPQRPGELTATADRHRQTSLRLQPPLPNELRLELTRSFVVLGTFVDAEGAGVPDGDVRILSGRRMRQQELGDGGGFELELEPDEAVRLELRSSRTSTLELDVEPGLPGEVRELGVVAAPPGLTVVGRLLRADTAEPVPGARVWTPRPSEQGPLVAWVLDDIVETRSNATGEFEVTGLPPVPLRLRIEAADLARKLVSVSPEPDIWLLDLGDVELESGAELIVRLVEDGETRQSEARAIASADLGGLNLGTDLLRAPVIDGIARIAHLPAGEVTVGVTRGGRFLCEAATTIEPGADSTEVTCHSRRIEVSGRVEVGGRPAGPGLLSWLVPSGEEVPEVIMNFGGESVRQQQVFTPRRPNVQVPVDDRGRFSTRELRPGRWPVLWMPHAGAAAGPVEVVIPATDAYQTVLQYPGQWISGVVVDGARRPVEGARVRRLDGSAFARSEADGSFVLAGLTPGVHRIQARSGDRISDVAEVAIEADRRPQPVELVLGTERPDLIVSVLTAEGLSAAGALVFIEGAGRPLRILTASDAGRASAPLRPPVPPRLRAAAHHRGGWVLGDWTDTETSRGVELTLDLPETGSLHVLSEEAAGRPAITGPGGWNLTTLLSWLGTPPSVAPSSPLVLSGLPPGRYILTLGAGTSGDKRVVAVVESGEMTEVEID